MKPKPCVDFGFVGLIMFDFSKIKKKTVMSCLWNTMSKTFGFRQWSSFFLTLPISSNLARRISIPNKRMNSYSKKNWKSNGQITGFEPRMIRMTLTSGVYVLTG